MKMLEQNPLKNFTKLDKMGAFLIAKSSIKQLYINVSKSFIKFDCLPYKIMCLSAEITENDAFLDRLKRL